MRIKRCDADRLLWIPGRAGLRLQNAWYTVDFTDGIDVGNEVIVGTESPRELDLLG